MTLNKLYIKQSSMKVSGQWIYLDPAIDLASIRLYSLFMQLSNDKEWHLINDLILLFKVYQIDNINILIDRLFLFRYISVEYENNDVFIIIYHEQLSINHIIECNGNYAKFVCDYPNAHFNDQLYANQIAEEAVYFASVCNANTLDRSSTVYKIETIPNPVYSVNNHNSVSGVNNVNSQNSASGVNNVNSQNSASSVNNVNSQNSASGVNNVNSQNSASGVNNVNSQNSASGVNNVNSQNSASGVNNVNSQNSASGVNNVNSQNSASGVNNVNSQNSASSVITDNCLSMDNCTQPKENKSFNNNELANDFLSNQKIVLDNKFNTVEHNYTTTVKDTSEFSSGSSCFNINTTTTEPLLAPKNNNAVDSHSLKLAPSKITQYTINQLDWTDVPSNRGDHHYFYNAFRAEHLNLEQAQNILNVIAHKHRANESIKHLPAFLRTLITTAKNGTLYPVWVKKDRGHNVPGKGSKTDGVRSQRELMREHHINYAAFIDQGQNELAQNYLIEHALIFKDGRIVCHE